jgi:polyribonucleotide nucleotidyltransferase
MLRNGLADARNARLHILEQMKQTIAEPRPELSPLAPRILTMKIDPTRIGEVIGSGGKVINGIIEKTGVVSIDIDEDGTVYIASSEGGPAEQAKEIIDGLLREIVEGEILEGDVIKILEFGAIVDLGGGKSGMIHVSELKDGFVKNVRDVVKEGDHVRVKVLKVENGKTSLSIRQAEEKK